MCSFLRFCFYNDTLNKTICTGLKINPIKAVNSLIVGQIGLDWKKKPTVLHFVNIQKCIAYLYKNKKMS